MKLEEMYDRISVCDTMIDSVLAKLENAKKIGWGSWENYSVDYFFDNLHNQVDDEDYIVGATWIFDKMSFDRTLLIDQWAIEHNIYVLSFPEIPMFILCKNKECLEEALKRLPQEMIEKSLVNIRDIEECDNGVLFKYYNKVKFVEYKARPDCIYEFIEEERKKCYNNGK